MKTKQDRELLMSKSKSTNGELRVFNEPKRTVSTLLEANLIELGKRHKSSDKKKITNISKK